MSKKRKGDRFSANDLRWLLMEKQRASRQQRLAQFRRTGRIALEAPETEMSAAEETNLYHPKQDDFDDLGLDLFESKRRPVFERLLLAVEVLAILGLFFIIFNGVNIIRELNREVISSFDLPTPSPTALITAIVLPSGHTPPDSPGGARPNEAEIPEHLRPLIQAIANIPIPTPGPKQAIGIQIPAIRINAPVVQGDGWEQLKKGVGQYLASSDPGEPGNLVLSAHNDIFGELFRDLDQLKPGDLIYISNTQRIFTYIVSGTQIVEPSHVEVLESTKDSTLTLISCYPYLIDTKRIVVTANLQN